MHAEPLNPQNNRYNIVTGGSGVLGLAACRALLEHGASGVSIFDVLASISSGKEVITRLQEDFPRAKVITRIVDVRDDATVHAAVSETAVELGSVDILLCFAGIVGTTHAIDMDVAEWKRVLDINTTGSWVCAQAVAKCVYVGPLIDLSFISTGR